MSYGVVYRIRNIINGKEYIGITTRGEGKRFKEHCKADSYLGKAIRKHGERNFRLSVVDAADSAQELTEKEISWIDRLGTFGNGYNQTNGGDGVDTVKKIEVVLNSRQKRFIEYVEEDNKKPIDVNDSSAMVGMALINSVRNYLLADNERDKKLVASMIMKLKECHLKQVFNLNVIDIEEFKMYC